MSRKKHKRGDTATTPSPAAEPATSLAEDEAPVELARDEAPPLELSEEALDLVRQLEDERNEALAARQRALADYVNFQKRSAENERRALARGTADVVRSLLQVIDHLDLALGQDCTAVTVEQLLEGVRLVRQEITKVFQSHGVEIVEPQPGEEFDPNCQEAMMRQSSADIEPDHIVITLQAGYRMGEVILRPAKVIIADPPAGSGDDDQE